MKNWKVIKNTILNAPSNIFWEIIDILTSRFGFLESYYEKTIGEEYIREYRLFNIKSGEKVLHIGCGSYPLSEIILSQIIHAKVVGIDKNSLAIKKAIDVIRQRGLKNSIEIIEGDGLNYPMKNFDIIIISSCAYPKIPILKHVFKNINSNTRVILREKEISIKPIIDYLQKQKNIVIIDKIIHHPFPFYHPLGWESYYLQRK